jgi:hypothetical protein
MGQYKYRLAETCDPSLSTLPTPIALLALRRLAMFDHMGPLAMRTVQHLDDHGSPSLAVVSLASIRASATPSDDALRRISSSKKVPDESQRLTSHLNV